MITTEQLVRIAQCMVKETLAHSQRAWVFVLLIDCETTHVEFFHIILQLTHSTTRAYAWVAL
jgi:hypothetical protein